MNALLSRHIGLSKIQTFLSSRAGRVTNLSKTWENTISVKGAKYTPEELNDMRRPYSAVCRQIVSFHQFSDEIAVAELVQDGSLGGSEDGSGNPVLDLEAVGTCISSHSIIPRKVAAKVARFLQLEKSRAYVIEIGAGVGLVPYFLKKIRVFEVTYVIVDIPETLQLSFWTLTASFPDAIHVIVDSDTSIREIERADFVYVVPEMLDRVHLNFDFAINCNSFGEMTAETSNNYLNFIQGKLKLGGHLFVSNIFGADKDSVRAPPDYDYGLFLKVIDCDCRSYFEYAGPNYLFFDITFKKVSDVQSPITRKQDLYFLYNMACWGVAPPASFLEAGFMDHNGNLAFSDFLPTLFPKITQSALPQLQAVYLAGSPVTRDRSVVGAVGHSNVASSKRHVELTVRNFQYDLAETVRLFCKAGPCELRADATKLYKAFSERTRSLVENSDFYAAYTSVAGIAISDSWMADWADYRVRETKSHYWLLRFSFIYLLAGDIERAKHALSRVNVAKVDVSWWPMLVSIAHRAGETEFGDDVSKRLIDHLKTLPRSHDLMLTFARVLCAKDARMELSDVIKMFLDKKISTEHEHYRAVGSLAKILGNTYSDVVPSFYRTLVSLARSEQVPFAVRLRCLQSVNPEKSEIEKILDQWYLSVRKNYFGLGAVLGGYLEIGDLLKAKLVAEESLLLRGKVAKHCFFLGSSFYAHRAYEPAAKYFEYCADSAYEDVIGVGYAAFANLFSSSYSSIFSASTPNLVYQRDQSLYFSTESYGRY